jgi:hypothetical protein
LREAIRDVLGHFWRESFGQIYPALAGLERKGFVQRSGSARNGLLLRLFFGRTLGVEACRRPDDRGTGTGRDGGRRRVGRHRTVPARHRRRAT